ncbi:major facilitator superfamily domain-containing protein [Mycena rosella]|uniref:Major facilitator superfamily domain-containing protein n=1 Tax=Mycena rosella TaxID=1033263 RepID=A0AAD7CW44_MYCRO|nr:major facilitator superfamily domain-containing protein [Mycena rosella]
MSGTSAPSFEIGMSAAAEPKVPSELMVKVAYPSDNAETAVQQYRLYRRRFLGLAGFIVLNIVSGWPRPWFGSIANQAVSELGYTLDRVNWLGNIMTCACMPVVLSIPALATHFGLRKTCFIGAGCLVAASWVRYSGTSRSLSPNHSYALVLLGQLFSAVSQPVFLVLAPKYSETWFDLRGRTAATMVIAIANPIGGAIAQLISSRFASVRHSILGLAIVSTAVAPCVLLIGDAPPTPPTYSGSTASPSLPVLIKALFGKETAPEPHMEIRERIDFAVLLLVFGTLVATSNAFALLSGQIMVPQGYSDHDAGLMGATLLLCGIAVAVVTAPLFDRVFTTHLARTMKLLVPIVAGGWFSLIWAVKPHNAAALFVIMAIIGASSLTLLPVALELGCEVTRNAQGSSALLWFIVNLFEIIFVQVQGALRAGPGGTPPLNMHRALVFNGAFVLSVALFVFLIRGKQVRKELDERMQRRAHQPDVPMQPISRTYLIPQSSEEKVPVQ